MPDSLELQLRNRLQEYLDPDHPTIKTAEELEAHIILLGKDPRASDPRPKQMLDAVRSVFAAVKEQPFDVSEKDIREMVGRLKI